MSASNSDTLRRFIETVWNQDDLDAIGGFLAPAYEIRHDPGDPWNGKTLDAAGLTDRIRVSRAPFPDQRFTILHCFENGNDVAIFWDWKATHQGDIAGFPATGKTIAMSGATIYFFEDGKIAGHWQVADRLGVMQQLAKR
ncbi:ester cyclase [Hyphococcus sp.]|uniref:ester cyclase n=1 Tax=Hyphococcus sp. TaxID=2038636 RepID=UPI0035C69F90